MKRLGISFLTTVMLFASTAGLQAKASCKSKCEAYDYVIVGGGTAGAALAAKLSDKNSKGKYKNSVCVLEAGMDESENPLVRDAINAFIAAAGAGNPEITTVSNTYISGVDINPYAIFPQWDGIMWGGSSGHNYLASVRGTPAQYDEWAALSGNSRWSYNNLVNNVMIPMEHYTPNGTISDASQRGSNGPLFITQARNLDQDPFLNAIAAATQVGYVDDYNSFPGGEVGASNIQYWTTPPFAGANSIRSYSGNSYLRGIPAEGVSPIVNADGTGVGGRKLKVISNAHANRVLFSKNKSAKAVQYTVATDHEKTMTVCAKKCVILCTGSLQDPAILQRSGIGDQVLLDSLGIPVVFANSNVGNHLTSHFGPQAIFGDVDTTISYPEIAQVMFGFAPNTDVRTYQGLVNGGTAFFPPNLADALGIPEQGSAGLHAFDVTPASRGNVKIVSRDQFRKPLINLGLYTDVGGGDAQRVLEFYKTIVPAIVAESGTTLLYPTADQYAGGDDALFRAGIDSLLIAYHPSSTCRMAQSANDGVVDGNLNVFGVKRLKVASNSVVPVINQGNAGYTAYVVGLEAARILQNGE